MSFGFLRKARAVLNRRDWWTYQGDCKVALRTPTSAYSKVKVAGKEYLCHRLSWMVSNWERIPEGHEIHHECHNRACFNPGHLSLISAEDHRKEHSGAGNGRAKLSREQFNKLWDMIQAGGKTDSELAKEFDISRRQIGRIRRGENWRNSGE